MAELRAIGSTLDTLIQFIQSFEQAQKGRSTYEIVNRLRGYTKAAYTTRSWTIATGFSQKFIDGALDGNVLVAGEITDFGHFIAALSDQIQQPGFQAADLTTWTADHTAWAGDIGSAIATYRKQSAQFASVQEVLDRYASDSDLAANVAAYVIGQDLNQNSQISLSQSIQNYNSAAYCDHVEQFLRSRFAINLVNGTIDDPAKLEAQIRKSVYTYLQLSPESGILQFIKGLFKGKPKLPESQNIDWGSADLLAGSAHLMRYLVRKGNLQTLTLQPYQFPDLPSFGRLPETWMITGK
ncbi:hypothetical protein ACN4EG_12770 [Alkalinema pantanalense CENA528]|uniref:hypothetical protein n=1 Tax=Alkalinema pantanalense TaxID=1620705 RepID=UPI003D6F24E1